MICLNSSIFGFFGFVGFDMLVVYVVLSLYFLWNVCTLFFNCFKIASQLLFSCLFLCECATGYHFVGNGAICGF